MALQPGAPPPSPLTSSTFPTGTFPSSPFLESLIRFLMPYFIGTAVGIEAARADILETLDAYGTRTRAEMLAAARIVALGMTTLDTLSQAAAADLSPAMKLRYRSCANGLNRAISQTEKALDQSLAREIPAPAVPPRQPQPNPIDPNPIDPEPINPAPIDTVADAETQATIDHATAAIQSHRDRVAGLRPATPTRQDRTQQLWAGAMMDTLKQMGIANPAVPGA